MKLFLPTQDDVHSLQVGEALAFGDTAFANDRDCGGGGDERAVVAINDSAGDVGTEITLPSGANVTLESDGTYSHEPAGEFESLSHGESASDTFEYTMSDGRGDGDHRDRWGQRSAGGRE